MITLIKAFIFAGSICSSLECRIENVKCMKEYKNQVTCSQLVGGYYNDKL